MDGNRITDFLTQLNKTRRRLTPEELEFLYTLSGYASPAVRSEVAALLADHYEEKSEYILLRLSRDNDYSVRVNAVDSLCIARKEATVKRLLFLIENDSVYMVRGYAVHSFYDVFVNILGDSTQALKTIAKTLKPLLAKEENRWVQTCYYCVLYLCGEKSYLTPILECLDDENDYVRNSVLITFEDILDEENKAVIEEAIQDALLYEENERLNMKMEDLLALIGEFEEEWP